MKIYVLVPSEAYRQNAGARIRYGRLTEALANHGVDLRLAEIGLFDFNAIDADLLLISKCHDARARLVAVEACRRGVRVGIDLFDDYFSQQHDARLSRFRRWLAELAPWLSFALTSTRTMAEVASEYLADVPVLVVNDPAATGPAGEMLVASSDEIDAKRRKAVDEQVLRIAWFGIGDNPYFAVGISDVAAFASELAVLARLSGMAVKLNILTNARALTADGLAKIADLPVSFEIHEWSEAAEEALLQESFACFVPVNAQPFSTAKSLNRAITALTAGCQLISAGYPLYEPLGSFVYRDVQMLAADLKCNDLRVAPRRRDDLLGILERWASADIEAEALATFFESLPVSGKSSLGRIALVHGSSTNDATNKLAQAFGVVTVGSPYAPKGLDLDAVAVARAPLGFDLLLTEQLADDLRHGTASLGGSVSHGKKSYVQVVGRNGLSELGEVLDLASASLGTQLALYGSIMAGIRDRLTSDLGLDEVLVSENSSLPFSLAS